MKNHRTGMRVLGAAFAVGLALCPAAGLASGGQHGANFRGVLGPQWYGAFEIDTAEDPFVNTERFRTITGGMDFTDENGDGICDIVQDTGLFAGLGGGEFVDENGDGICDLFQTRQAYQALRLQNYVDVDGDGVCDNYEENPLARQEGPNFRGVSGPQYYHGFEVETSEDVFVHPGRFHEITGGMDFTDENGDGICDIVQDTGLFAGLGGGEFVDENGDGICDLFQTRQAYQALRLQNYVDVDGDGICDNYELHPRPITPEPEEG